MTNNKKVVLIGWNPKVLTSKDKPYTAQEIMSSLQAEQKKLTTLGYQANFLFIDNANTAYEDVKQALMTEDYACVLVGAGVRTTPESFLVFEQLINAVHQSSPKAKICFNTNPNDTLDAVQRWI